MSDFTYVYDPSDGSHNCGRGCNCPDCTTDCGKVLDSVEFSVGDLYKVGGELLRVVGVDKSRDELLIASSNGHTLIYSNAYVKEHINIGTWTKIVSNIKEFDTHSAPPKVGKCPKCTYGDLVSLFSQRRYCNKCDYKD